ncbi:tigger transposable element-derived protein 4-like [Mercenaria mercenaria]|uniref:tigger transposable element-derived protein 4-like n=1 Tax=Mercenaria mercenaria TaxID=6596 RepID=UPI00234F8A3A|nr:tigger transposable element-derived protein 4-like [Mercenaria mercenaria]
MSKRKVLTLDDRARVLELSKNKSARKIAEEMGVGKTQIQNILKRKAEVLEDIENNVSGDRKRARRVTVHEDVNNLVYEWFKDVTARRLPVSGPILCTQALKFASDLGDINFKASTGWLASFLKRNNIVLGTMSGERGDVNKDTVTDWKSKLPTVCDGYDPKDIFNMDETGLFFRDTTRKSYHFKDSELVGGKRSKERITVSLCASMTGEKLKPLVIGKAARPRCFSKIDPEKLPVTYRNNKKAWMTGELMTEWLRTVDKQMKKQRRNILLFLDNAPAHPDFELNNVKLVFLPPNTTALSQPMDQGIIQALKLKFRNRQLSYIVSQMERTDKVGSQVLKEISILDAIYWINGSWKEVTPTTIQKCFAKCGFDQISESDLVVNECDSDDDSDDDDVEVPLAVLRMSHELFGCEYHELVDLDKSVPTCDENNSIVDWDKNAGDILIELQSSKDVCDNDECDDGVDSDRPETVITMSEASDMLDKLKMFALSKGQDKWLDNIMDLQDMFVSCRAETQCKQTRIHEFFERK